MAIEKVERFYCPRCGYITESRVTIGGIKKTGICPACQNGDIKEWTNKERTNMGILEFKHSEETKRKMSERQLGPLHHNWKGGTWVKEGYIEVHRPTHPFCNNKGYVMEHRLVLENALGRYLLPTEIVHHINEIRDDNRLENLLLNNSHGEHFIIHCIGRKRNGKGQFVKEE